MNGYNLEKQVEGVLRKDGWEILPNAHYKDPATQKAREKDFVATSPQFSGEPILNYNARLFIECKYFPKQMRICPSGTTINEIENIILAFNIPYADISDMERHKKFHFNDYAKIFSTKGGEDKLLHEAINQTLQSFSAFRNNNPENAVYYLIIVYDGELKAMDQDGNDKIYGNALIKIDTLDDIYNLPNKKCFIELVSISQFENILKKIREDIQKINGSARFYQRMRRNQDEKKKEQIRNDSCK